MAAPRTMHALAVEVIAVPRLVFAAFLLLVSLLVGLWSPALAAGQDDASSADLGAGQTSPIQMAVSAGFGGIGRANGWLPVAVDVLNGGSDAQVEIRVLAGIRGASAPSQPVRGFGYGFLFPGTTPTSFVLPASLPSGSHKHFELDVSLPSSNPSLTTQVVQTSDQTVLAQQDTTVTPLPPGEIACGVVGTNAAAYSFLGSMDFPAPVRRVRTIPLEIGDIPSDARLMDGLDCLILDDVDSAQLSQEQMDALKIWMNSGGMLVGVGGASWQTTLRPLEPGLLPVDVAGTTRLSTLSSLAALANAPLPSAGPWLVSQARVHTDEGAQVALSEGGTPLIVAEREGDGVSLYLAFQPSARDFATWDGNQALWRFILDNVPLAGSGAGATSRPALQWGRAPRTGLLDFSGQPPVTLEWLLGLAPLYLLGLGAALGLARRGKAGTSAVAVVGCTVLATTVGVGLALYSAAPDLAVTQVSIVRPLDSSGVAALTRDYLAMQAQRDGTYSVDLPDGDLGKSLYNMLPQQATSDGSPWMLRVREGSHQSMDGLTMQEGQTATAQVDGQMIHAPHVDGELDVAQDGLSGTLVNSTGGRLSNTFVVQTGRSPQSLGSVDAGQSVSVALPYVSSQTGYRPAGAATSLVDLLSQGNTPSGVSGAAQRDILTSLFSTTGRPTDGSMDFSSPTLLGWMDQMTSQMSVPTVGITPAMAGLLIQPLTVRLPRGFEGPLPPQVLTRRELSAAAGTGSGDTSRGYTVQPGEAETLQFSLPAAQGSFQLEQLQVHATGEVSMKTADSPPPTLTVSLFNWQAATWQDWSVAQEGSSIPSPQQYLSPTGDVRLRFAVDASLADTVQAVRLSRLDVTPIGAVQ